MNRRPDKQSIGLGIPKTKRKRKRHQRSSSPNAALGIVGCAVVAVFSVASILYYATTSSSSGLFLQRYTSKVVSPHAAVAGLNTGGRADGGAAHQLRGAAAGGGGPKNRKTAQKHPYLHPVNRANVVKGPVSKMNLTIHEEVHQQAAQEQVVPPLQGLSEEALEMCTRTLWHTLETTTIVLPNKETFIHTGDIDDLWLRDSASQIHPLLIPVHASANDGGSIQRRALIYDDAKLDRVVSGLIARHALYIRHDPYANAFRIDDTYVFSEAQKRMGRHDLISTWNYELDSGCFTIRMLYYYWKQSRDPNEALVGNPAVREAVSIMVDLWIAEQEHELDKYPVGKLFDCQNCNKPYRYPGLPRDGKGATTNATAGLTWTGFRPSDDECRSIPYLMRE